MSKLSKTFYPTCPKSPTEQRGKKPNGCCSTTLISSTTPSCKVSPPSSPRLPSSESCSSRRHGQRRRADRVRRAHSRTRKSPRGRSRRSTKVHPTNVSKESRSLSRKNSFSVARVLTQHSLAVFPGRTARSRQVAFHVAVDGIVQHGLQRRTIQ